MSTTEFDKALSPSELKFVKQVQSPNYKATVEVWSDVTETWHGALSDQRIADTILRRRIIEQRMTTDFAKLKEKKKLYALFGLPFTEDDLIWRLENPEAARIRNAVDQISSALKIYEGMAKGLSYSDTRGNSAFSDNVLLEKWGIITKQDRRWIIRPNADVSRLRERLAQLEKRFAELVSTTDLAA